jgi:hypothetical protein
MRLVARVLTRRESIVFCALSNVSYVSWFSLVVSTFDFGRMQGCSSNMPLEYNAKCTGGVQFVHVKVLNFGMLVSTANPAMTQLQVGPRPQGLFAIVSETSDWYSVLGDMRRVQRRQAQDGDGDGDVQRSQPNKFT